MEIRREYFNEGSFGGLLRVLREDGENGFLTGNPFKLGEKFLIRLSGDAKPIDIVAEVISVKPTPGDALDYVRYKYITKV